jgi:hypothetical protein
MLYIDCGPDSYVLGSFPSFQSGCDREALAGTYTTREACDSACRANLVNLCVLFSNASCFMYNEKSPGNCDAPIEAVSKYQRWTVCNSSSALLRV